MAALTDLSDVINRCTGGDSGTPENLFFWKDSRVDSAAAVAPQSGRWTSLWQYEGSPAGGAAPGSVAAPDNTTDGGLKQTDPGGGRQKWLLGGVGSCNNAGTLVLYDRLLHISGLSGTSTSAQTVGGTLTRYTGSESVGNQIWIEIYTTIGNTSRTITASYTDESGNSGSTSTATAIGNSGLNEAQRIIPLPLATGDTGVRAVASVTLSASTGTAGDFGVTVVRPLLIIPITAAGAGNVRSLLSALPGPQEIKADACLALAFYSGSTTALQAIGSVSTIEA